MKRYELTKEQWERVKPLLPPEETGKRGRPRKDNLNGMLWIARSSAQWRELPEAYGLWQSVYARFAKWRDDGTLKKVFRALSEDADTENLSMDSTCIRENRPRSGFVQITFSGMARFAYSDPVTGIETGVTFDVEDEEISVECW